MLNSVIPKVKIREVASINENSLRKDYPFNEIEYVDISSMGTGSFVETPQVLPFSEAPSRARRLVKAGDVIISTVRPNRRSFYYFKEPKNNTVVSTGFAVLSPNELIDPRYLYYWISQQEFSDYLTAHAKGAAYPAVAPEDIGNAEIFLPTLSIQSNISTILSAYDDLIENNTLRIKILEDMAQLIYREWFVNFRFPGHEKIKLVNSELGKIPEGWFKKYPDYVDFLEGPGLRNWQYRNEGMPFLNIRTLVSNDIDSSKLQFIDQKEADEKYKHFYLEPYDHVVSSSGTIGRIVTVQKRHLPLMLNTSVIRMRPKAKSIGKWQLKHFLLSDYFQNQIKAHAIGAAQMNYGPSHLNLMSIIAPDEEIGQRYELLVDPIEEMICTLVKKNNLLRQTRDLLLPKLISGELDVSELDIEVVATK